MTALIIILTGTENIAIKMIAGLSADLMVAYLIANLIKMNS